VTPSGAASWRILGTTTEKPVNDYFRRGDQVVWRKNEDRFHFTDHANGMVAAVADGAGSSGLYCGPWAEKLVTLLPTAPVAGIDDLNGWIDGFWQDFSSESKKQVATDPTKLNKFVREGSCSTLVACWLNRNDDGEGVTLNWVGYGDSPLFVFSRNPEGLKLSTLFPDTLSALDRDPHLLNWKDLPDAAHLKAGQIVVLGPAIIVLASDGIGQYLLLRYLTDLHFRSLAGEKAADGLDSGLLTEFRHLLNGGSGKLADMAAIHVEHRSDGFSKDLEGLRQALENPAVFPDVIKEHHSRGLLPNDDSTMVMIDLEQGTAENGADPNDLSTAVNEP
jgi:hypothetical protein